MKRKGNHFEYSDLRDKCLLQAYRNELAVTGHIVLRDVMAKIVDSPCERFWVSSERAAIVLSEMFKGGSIGYMRPLKQEMYLELYRLASIIMETHPEMTMRNIAQIVVIQKAPKFYLTPESAKIIIHHIKRRWFLQQKIKYRPWLLS